MGVRGTCQIPQGIEAVLNEVGVELTRSKILVLKHKAGKRQGRFTPHNNVFVDGPDGACQRQLPGGGMHHKFGNHGIVVNGDGGSLFHAVVHADSWSLGTLVHVEGANVRNKILAGVLGIDPDFHRMAVDVQVFLGKRQGMAFRNAQLFADQIYPGNHFGYRMFHLQPGVHFQKVEGPAGIENKLDGPRTYVAACLGNANGGLPHLGTQFRRQNNRRRLFNDLLVPTLNAAFPFKQVDRVSVLVCQDLNFDVTRRSHVLFHKNRSVAKSRNRFVDGQMHLLFKIFQSVDNAHALSSPTGCRLD